MAKITSKDGTVITYEQSGNGPALILVDGALAYREHRGGRPLAAELSRDFTVLTYDRRGRGESTDVKPYTTEKEIQDIEALIDTTGGAAYLYGFSSGAVLALRATAQLNSKVRGLILHEPPFNSDAESEKHHFIEHKNRINQLIADGRNSDAVEFFLGGMVPAEVLEQIKKAPDWKTMVSVAHTLAYENEIMGEGSVPAKITASVTVPTLVLVGSESHQFKHTAADALVKVLPNAAKKVLEGQSTLVSPQMLAPVITKFLKKEPAMTV